MDTQTNTNTPGSTGFATNANRDELWRAESAKPVQEILSKADVAAALADVDIERIPPVDAITRCVAAYQASGDPNTLLLVARFAQKEFLNPNASIASKYRGRDTGHEGRSNR